MISRRQRLVSEVRARFCPRCAQVHERARPEVVCVGCRLPLMPVVDDQGCLTREYLLSRRKCCENDCRHCPFERSTAQRCEPQ